MQERGWEGECEGVRSTMEQECVMLHVQVQTQLIRYVGTSPLHSVSSITYILYFLRCCGSY